jgi:hypothetical protein
VADLHWACPCVAQYANRAKNIKIKPGLHLQTLEAPWHVVSTLDNHGMTLNDDDDDDDEEDEEEEEDDDDGDDDDDSDQEHDLRTTFLAPLQRESRLRLDNDNLRTQIAHLKSLLGGGGHAGQWTEL